MEETKIITRRPSKYVLKYGYSLKEIAKLFGVSKTTIHNWLNNEGKREWMESILKDL